MITGFIPRIFGKDIDFTQADELKSLEATLKEQGITHVEDTDGKVWRLAGRINKKSVPLNAGDQAPQRLKFDQVRCFGTVDEDTTTAENPAPEATPEPAHHSARAHALLSASSANRWLHCTPSAVLEDQYPDSSSAAAEEGTAAHELAEHKLRLLADLPTTRPESEWQNEDMESHTDDYADHVMAELARAQETSPAAFLAIEERLDFSHLVPDGFGTGDAVIVGDGTMTIIDLKYGKGVEVSAEENPQMMLYALGALNLYSMIYNITQVRMVIYQPRLHNISVWETAVDNLTQWATETVKPTAEIAAKGEGELRAGAWCQFCRHAPRCTALMKEHFAVIPTQGAELTPAAPNPETLSDGQVATIVAHSGEIKKWLTSVEKFATAQANEGHTYPGLKLVEGRSVRRYTDPDAVAQAVEKAGEDPWERKLLGITAMQKLLGKKTFDETLGDLLHKPAGAPTLVPESDKRPTLTVATPENVFEPLGETA